MIPTDPVTIHPGADGRAHTWELGDITTYRGETQWLDDGTELAAGASVTIVGVDGEMASVLANDWDEPRPEFVVRLSELSAPEKPAPEPAPVRLRDRVLASGLTGRQRTAERLMELWLRQNPREVELHTAIADHAVSLADALWDRLEADSCR